MRKLRRFLIAVAVAAFAVWLLLPEGGPRIEDGSILVLDIEGELVEMAEPPFFARFMGRRGRPFGRPHRQPGRCRGAHPVRTRTRIPGAGCAKLRSQNVA